jgi:hypothetical protein
MQHSLPASAYPSSANLPLPLRPDIGDRITSFSNSVTDVFTQRHLGSHETEKNAKDEIQLNEKDPSKLPFRERIRHFTWTWFTMTMATGGIANVL